MLVAWQTRGYSLIVSRSISWTRPRLDSSVTADSLSFHLHHDRFPCFSSLYSTSSLSIGKLKKKLYSYTLPPLMDSDLDEKFIRGRGPGGQKINKTSNCVQLTHLPSGLVVKCQAERSLEHNRKEARKLLQLKLDNELHGVDSKLSLKRLVHLEQQRVAARKRRKKETKDRD